MLSNLHISNFRSFRELHVPRLSRVNLFVGPNNAGKTSILEAAEILASGMILSLEKGPRRRAERMEGWLDLAHLFHGHLPTPGNSFRFESEGSEHRWVACEIVQKSPAQRPEDFAKALSAGEVLPGTEVLRFSSHEQKPIELPFTDGKLPDLSLPEIGPPVQFLGTEGMDQRRLGAIWDKIHLNPEEDKVTEALRIIEPRAHRIGYSSTDSGFFLTLHNFQGRVPLGSIGDGTKRLLSLALHLSASQDGFLLVDEIDTGLHHETMDKMWRMVIGTARRLNVQVLATTHSLDCVHALAWVHESDPALAADVTLHRVEKDLTQTTSYTAEKLAIAARHHIEVR